MISAILALNVAKKNSYDASIGMMRCSDELRSLAFGASKDYGMKDLGKIAAQEKAIMSEKMRHELMYRISEEQVKAYEKMVDKRIKESFSFFA